MIISPAMMKVFEECQQKYKYIYIDKISLPQNKRFFEKGKNIHAIANYYIKGFDVTKLENSMTEEEKKIWNYLKSLKYFKYDLLKSEYQISSKLGETWIGGRIDALVKNDENYYILDYKTGSVPQNPEYDFQTIVYLLCTDKLIKKYKSLNFVYLDLKNNDEKIISFNEDLRQKYIEKIKKILFEMNLVKISNSVLLKNNKCNCDYCCICPKF